MKHEDYPMPALTDEQREQLTGRLVYFLGLIQNLRNSNSQTEADELDFLIAQISLSAINAGIFHEGQRCYVNEDDECIHYWVDLSELQYERSSASPRRIRYTAPPVPALKLPGELTWSHQDNVTQAEVLAWNSCLAEVKRLNGVG